MTTETWLSLAALAVSICALPVSYFVARQQVKMGLDEHESRIRQRTRGLVADRLDELMSLFFSAARALAGVDMTQPGFDTARLGRHIQQVDEAVQKTGILDRLGKSMDDYTESGDVAFQANRDVSTRLEMIRGQIHRGSTAPASYATWDILNVCRGNELSELLRKK